MLVIPDVKQGDKQALFYSGVDTHDPEEKQVFRSMALLDGWFNQFNFLMNVITTLPTSDAIIYFMVSQKTYFDVIGPSLTMKNPFGTYANEDGMAYHGLPDMVPFPVFWSQIWDDNMFMNLKLVQEQKVDAGKDLVFYVSGDNLVGANATGAVYVTMEHKQIISPRKFK